METRFDFPASDEPIFLSRNTFREEKEEACQIDLERSSVDRGKLISFLYLFSERKPFSQILFCQGDHFLSFNKRRTFLFCRRLRRRHRCPGLDRVHKVLLLLLLLWRLLLLLLLPVVVKLLHGRQRLLAAEYELLLCCCVGDCCGGGGGGRGGLVVGGVARGGI